MLPISMAQGSISVNPTRIREAQGFGEAHISSSELLKLENSLKIVERGRQSFRNVSVLKFPPSDDYNAMTLFKNVDISDTLVVGLTQKELTAIIAHEAAHARHWIIASTVSIASSVSRLAAQLAFLGLMISSFSAFSVFGIAAVPVWAAAACLGNKLVKTVHGTLNAFRQRRLEIRADRNALNFVKKEDMISALTYISSNKEDPNSMEQLFSTNPISAINLLLTRDHPSLSKRIRKLEAYAKKSEKSQPPGFGAK